MLFSTPGLSQYISGVIVYDETLRSTCVLDGMAPVRHLQAQGIVVGIKVDKGLTVIPGTESENSTQGLDGLGDRCAEYYRMGARFAKWRAIYRISATTPSERAVQENSWALARYGAIYQMGWSREKELVLFIYLVFHFCFWLGTAPFARRMVWSR
jgi:fructose-bisphosphate aldolase, class I